MEPISSFVTQVISTIQVKLLQANRNALLIERLLQARVFLTCSTSMKVLYSFGIPRFSRFS